MKTEYVQEIFQFVLFFTVDHRVGKRISEGYESIIKTQDVSNDGLIQNDSWAGTHIKERARQ